MIPALGGNWVDLIILIIITFYLIGSWNRGFILATVDLAGFLFSFIAALKLYAFLGQLLILNFSLPKGIANALGFLSAGFIAEAFFSFISSLLIPKIYQLWLYKKSSSLVKYNIIDKVFGFIPVMGEVIILVSFLLTLLITLPIKGAIKKDILASKIGGPLIARTQTVERQLNLIFGEAVNETLTFLTINPNPQSLERLELGFNQQEIKIDLIAEEKMLVLINNERAKVGLSPLKNSLPLTLLSRDYGQDMFSKGYFSHYNPEGESPFDRMRKRGISFLAAGENLALAPNVILAHQGLMNSEGHRANILSSDFEKVGIGAVDGGIYGEIFVQEFTD